MKSSGMVVPQPLKRIYGIPVKKINDILNNLRQVISQNRTVLEKYNSSSLNILRAMSVLKILFYYILGVISLSYMYNLYVLTAFYSNK